MGDQSGSSPFQALFEPALQDYEKQTGITLANHPLAEKLQNCQSVESVTALLQEQARAFSNFRENDKITKSLKSVVSALSRVSATATLGQTIGMVCPR
jgi:fungal STAND N-terminal Goodbye domain